LYKIRLLIDFLAQSFYNLPAGDPLFQSNNISWYYNDLAFDLAGMGLNSGSGWIMRRLAVEEIGGFPTYCLVEDLCSSVLVLTEGWRTAYVPVAVQWGLVPETYAAEVKQRTRWVSCSFLNETFTTRIQEENPSDMR